LCDLFTRLSDVRDRWTGDTHQRIELRWIDDILLPAEEA
jgi:hypothetical protein